MTRFLMVPIHVDALFLDQPHRVVDAMADFSRMPFFDGRRDVNGNTAYLSESFVPQPFNNTNLTLEPGIHLHWSLPDTLTRSKPMREGSGQIDFPTAPNRWLIHRTGGGGVPQSWVVESDYLHPPDPQSMRRAAQAGSICYPTGGWPLVLETVSSVTGKTRTDIEAWLAKKAAKAEDAAEANLKAYLKTVAPLQLEAVHNELVRVLSDLRGWLRPEYLDANLDVPPDDHDQLLDLYVTGLLEGTQTPIDPPFCYLGRVLSLAHWQRQADSPASYLRKLTALGYGEPTFAAFYPNCRSVFGFHDPYPPAGDGSLVYYVVGWYHCAADDICQGVQSWEDLEERFSWRSAEQDGAAPQRTLCYARLTLDGREPPDDEGELSAVRVAVGNTPTEALSALLASEHDDDVERRKLEDQLEALHLMGVMEQRQIDITSKFREARHDRGFRTVPGGTMWTIQPQSPPSAKADSSQAVQQITLPQELAHTLNELNQAQQKVDTTRFEVGSWRRRIYADWYKYMLCVYPPLGQQQDYPDIDQVKFFIKNYGLTPLNALEKSLHDELEPQRDSHLNDLHEQLPALQLVTDEDINDWVEFIRQLKASPPEQILQALRDITPDEDAPIEQSARTAMVAELRQLGQLPDLRKQLGFPTDAVPDEVKALSKNQESWSQDVSLRYNRLLLQAHFPSLNRRPVYELRQIAGPRYYEPNEPVVLLQGEEVTPSDRHGADGVLSCAIIDLEAGGPPHAVNKMRQKINQIDADVAEKKAAGNPVVGFRHQKAAPWNPFLLEWEFELYPTGGPKSNLDLQDRAYDSDFITHNYRLEENAIDLTPSGENDGEGGRSVYFGRSNLTPYATIALRKRIDDYLERIEDQLLAEYCKAVMDDGESCPETLGQDLLPDVIDWYQDELEAEIEAGPQEPGQRKRDPFTLFVLESKQALSGEFHTLAQGLSGFNAALMGHKQTMQLPVGDPLSFDEYASFTSQVASAVGHFNRVAPQPLNDFNPIRSGTMKLAQLRLIDTFGRYRDVKPSDLDDVAPTDALRPRLADAPESGARHKIVLPPRLVQPARINLRWLSNGHGPGHEQDESRDDMEMNAHPATSPVCGWLMPNNLDDSLMVYNREGQAMGYVDRNGDWRPAPGGHYTVTDPTPGANNSSDQVEEQPDEAPAPPQKKVLAWNPHLKRVVQWILRTGNLETGFVRPFISALDSALENINPASWKQHQDLALLMGRPLAVVRATVELQQLGLPAVNQDWTIFRQNLKTDGLRDTDRVRAVEFPVRLGEHRQLDDGLAGYWIEDEQEGLSARLYSPQSNSNLSEAILTYPEPVALPTSWVEAAEALGVPVETTADLTPALIKRLIQPGPGQRLALSPRMIAALTPDQLQVFRTSDLALLDGDKLMGRKEVLSNLNLSLGMSPKVVTMLVDPRARVHATSGILPTKSINIPPDQFAPALQAIEVSFLSAPILTPRQTDPAHLAIDLPVPQEAGYDWTWVEKDGGAWKEAQTIRQVNRQADFSNQQELREGWLVLRKEQRTNGH